MAANLWLEALIEKWSTSLDAKAIENNYVKIPGVFEIAFSRLFSHLHHFLVSACKMLERRGAKWEKYMQKLDKASQYVVFQER